MSSDQVTWTDDDEFVEWIENHGAVVIEDRVILPVTRGHAEQIKDVADLYKMFCTVRSLGWEPLP